jgi:hypothetical protein
MKDGRSTQGDLFEPSDSLYRVVGGEQSSSHQAIIIRGMDVRKTPIATGQHDPGRTGRRGIPGAADESALSSRPPAALKCNRMLYGCFQLEKLEHGT